MEKKKEEKNSIWIYSIWSYKKKYKKEKKIIC